MSEKDVVSIEAKVDEHVLNIACKLLDFFGKHNVAPEDARAAMITVLAGMHIRDEDLAKLGMDVERDN